MRGERLAVSVEEVAVPRRGLQILCVGKEVALARTTTEVEEGLQALSRRKHLLQFRADRVGGLLQ